MVWDRLEGFRLGGDGSSWYWVRIGWDDVRFKMIVGGSGMGCGMVGRDSLG